MRKIILLSLLFLLHFQGYACPVCERNKAKLFQGITHGSSPDSNWDYIIVIVMVIVAIATLYYSIKWLIKPNENDISHIKNSILNEQ